MDLLFNKDSEASKEFDFSLRGDLGQMGSQRSFLVEMNIQVQQNNVYPVIRDCDVKKALTLIYQSKIEGWWNYDDEYKKFGICSKETFKKELHDQVKENKRTWENIDKDEPLRFKF